ncbi:hypothetical protein EMIT0P258_10392 [Pseudomonas sp. IT-P258]
MENIVLQKYADIARARALAPQKNVSTSVSDRIGNPVIIRASVPRLLTSSRYERIHEH